MSDDLETLLTTAREWRMTGQDPRGLRDAAARGQMVRPHRGSYLSTAQWDRLTEIEKYTLRIIGAITSGRENPIVSHISAAVLWGAPIIGPLPSLVHVLVSPAAGTRTEHGFRKHASSHRFDLERRGELKMTGLERTLADVAVDAPFVTAVGVLDWALAEHGVSKAAIFEWLDRLGIRRGRKRAERAIEFADAGAGSPGESLSRVRIHEGGFPAPILQHEIVDALGRVGFVDFWWPEHNLVGEFDGVAKYIREEYTRGRTPQKSFSPRSVGRIASAPPAPALCAGTGPLPGHRTLCMRTSSRRGFRRGFGAIVRANPGDSGELGRPHSPAAVGLARIARPVGSGK